MFEYKQEWVRELRAYFADAHRNGETIEFGGFEFATTETLHDGVNVIRAILVIADTMAQDEFETMFEDMAVAVSLGYIGSVFPVIAEEYAIAVDGFDIVENADGSAHAVATARRVTDTETVIIRHADGTTTVARQTASDALAVIENGHRTLAVMFENGDIENYTDDIGGDIIAE